MQRKQFNLPKPDWFEDENYWKFRIFRLEQCHNCESHLYTENDKEQPYANGTCMLCGCSTWHASGIKEDKNNKCPKKLWCSWDRWELIEKHKRK